MKPTKFTTKRSPISHIDPDHQPAFPRGVPLISTQTQQKQGTASMKQKRVRFSGVDQDLRRNVPSASLERNVDDKSADPKTSEYAFFKKLKETSAHGTNTLSDESQPKKLKSDDCFKEKSSAVKNRHEDPNTSSFTLNVTPDNSFSFMRHDCMSKNSEVNIHRPLTCLGDMQNLEVEDYGNLSRHGYQRKLIFSEKRQKLRRWVAETSLPEIDELCSKGYDYVSMLLSRLLPESDKDKSLNCLNKGQSQTVIDFKFNHDNPVKKLSRIPAKIFVDTEFQPPKVSSSPTYLLEFPWEKELPKSSNHASCSHDTHSENRMHELSCNEGNRATQISFTDSDSIVGISAEGHKSLASACLNELDKVRYQDECSHRREPQKFLLSWDFDRMADEKKSFVTTEIPFHSHDTYLDNRIHELGCKVDERATSASSDSSFGSYAEKHKSFPSNCSIELDRVRYPGDYSHVREPQKFLTDWDFDTMEDAKNSSITPEILVRSHGIYIDNRVHELDCNASERATSMSCANSDSLFGFCPERHKSFASTCLDPLDKVWHLDECSHGRESHKFILGWDFETMADEEKPTTVQELALYPISCRDEEQVNVNCRSQMYNPLEPYLLAHRDWSCSSGNHLNQFVFSYGGTTEGSSFLLSSPNQLRFMGEILTEEHHFPARETLFSPELDYNQGKTCFRANASSRDNYSTIYHALDFPRSEDIYSHTMEEDRHFPENLSEGRIISHLQQGMFNIHDWPSYYFRGSIDEVKACPLLLDDSHRNEPENGTYSEIDE